MHTPTAAELLNILEDGMASTFAERALLLLGMTFPELPREVLTAWSVGQRDAQLLLLRQSLWGPRMIAIGVCPECRERLELNLDIRNLLPVKKAMEAGALSLSIDHFDVTFRVPTTQDLLAAESEDDSAKARALILSRCVLSAQEESVPLSSERLPEKVIDEIASAMARADPLADIRLNVACPSCSHRWRTALDIVSFLWTEIEDWGARILKEVHTLALSYGWREADILALSATRRQIYLEMVRA